MTPGALYSSRIVRDGCAVVFGRERVVVQLSLALVKAARRCMRCDGKRQSKKKSCLCYPFVSEVRDG